MPFVQMDLDFFSDRGPSELRAHSAGPERGLTTPPVVVSILSVPLAEVGAAIRVARESRGMGLTDLARASGLYASSILRIERGERMLTPSTAERIAQALERSADDVEHVDPAELDALREDVPYPLDEVTAYVVHAHPDGLSEEYIARALHMSQRLVGTTLAVALAKLKAQSLEDSEVGELTRTWFARIAERREAREEREHAHDWMGGDDA